jgi:hypothetical protein
MSTEQNQPEPQGASDFSGNGNSNSSDTATGQGEGQAGVGQGRFRRRRRRKKPGANPGAGSGQNISASAAPQEGAPAGENFQPDAGADASPQVARPQQGQPGQGDGTGRRRRKKKGGKKFLHGGAGGQQTHQPGNRVQTHQPGNNFGGGGQNFGNGNGRRQKKGRGARSFVGPMDHSYRAVNGNYADSPPSTIQVNGNNNGGGRNYNRNAHMHDTGHQSQFLPTYYEPKPPTIAEDAPVKVYCFIDDLFVTAKITEAARKMGVKIAFVKGEKDDIAKITDEPEETRAHLILFDLNNVNAKPLTVIPKIRTKMKKSVSIIGFLSHLQGDLKGKAIEAGCDSVMPRAAFSQALPNLLRRYGLEEDLELQDSQHAYFS